MTLNAIGSPLTWTERPDCLPGHGQIHAKFTARGVCRVDRHAVDGELHDPQVPIIPGMKSPDASTPSVLV